MMKRLLLLAGIILCILFFSTFSFSQEPGNENLELSSLSLVQGKISLTKYDSEGYLLLVGSEGAQYALIGKIAKEEIKPLEDLENKKFTLVVRDLPQQIEFSGTENIYDSQGKYIGIKKGVFRYKVAEVIKVEKIEDFEGNAEEFVAVLAEEPQTAIHSQLMRTQAMLQPTLNLYNIKGKVISRKVGAKTVIPTLEIEYKKGTEKYKIFLIISNDTKIIKVVDGIPMAVMPIAIKQSGKVDVWFQQRGDQNFARIISILDKN